MYGLFDFVLEHGFLVLWVKVVGKTESAVLLGFPRPLGEITSKVDATTSVVSGGVPFVSKYRVTQKNQNPQNVE